jgi:hypothetical protein
MGWFPKSELNSQILMGPMHTLALPTGSTLGAPRDIVKIFRGDSPLHSWPHWFSQVDSDYNGTSMIPAATRLRVSFIAPFATAQDGRSWTAKVQP